MTTKTLSKSLPKPARVAKKAPNQLEAIESAYNLALTDEAREKLKDVKVAVDYLVAEAERAAQIEITDDATDQQGADATVNLTKARKALEELQSYFTTPLEKNKKAIIARFKDWLKEPLKQEERLRRAGEDYFAAKEKARLDAEKAQQQQALANHKQARQLGRAPVATPPAPLPPEPEKVVQSENGSRSMQMVPHWELVDLALVPDVYKMIVLNSKLVDAAVEGGSREIPGLKIEMKPQTVVR